MRAWRPRGKELSCQQVVELVTEYLEGALSPRMRRRFERHLAGCLACPEYVAQIRAVVLLAGRTNPQPAPPPSEEEALAVLRSLRGR